MPRKAAEGCAEIEPECDLVEEVLRLRGLDAVPPVSLPRASPVPLATLTPQQVRAALARRTLAAQGLAECVTFSFMAQSDAALFGDTPDALRLTNPIAADLDQLRPTPIATLALAAQRNAARGYPDVALFEIGPEFAVDAAEKPALDRRRAARRRDATQLARRRRGRSTRWTPRPICGRSMSAIGVPLDALMLTQDAPGFYPPRPLRHGAAGTEDRAGQFRRIAPARAGGTRPHGSRGRVPAQPRRRRGTEAPPQGTRRSCRRSSRSGATSRSWWTRQ